MRFFYMIATRNYWNWWESKPERAVAWQVRILTDYFSTAKKVKSHQRWNTPMWFNLSRSTCNAISAVFLLISYLTWLCVLGSCKINESEAIISSPPLLLCNVCQRRLTKFQEVPVVQWWWGVVGYRISLFNPWARHWVISYNNRNYFIGKTSL